MDTWNQMVITDIEPPLVVQLEKGRRVQTAGRGCFGLSLCVSGQITYTMGEQTVVSEPGKAVLLPQGGYYELVCDKDGVFPLINFSCTGVDAGEIRVFSLRNPDACLRLFESVQRAVVYNGGRFKQYSAFYELLDAVAALPSQTRTALEPALTFIAGRLSDPTLSNTAIAKHLGISEIYLRKLFEAQQGTSPHRYILDMRIRKAKQLLRDTPFTVTAIAEECGFSGLYHFCRVFKQKTGVTPTQYAQSHRILNL